MRTTRVDGDDWLRLPRQAGSARPAVRDRLLAAVVAGVCVGGAFLAVRNPAAGTPATPVGAVPAVVPTGVPSAARSVAASVVPRVVPPVVREVAGATAVRDVAGLRWNPGHHFVGGRLRAVGTVAGTASGGVYAWALDGVRSYSTPVPDGVYDVVLHFADSACQTRGCRRFGVRLEGATVASSLDIASLVGPAHAFSIVQRTAVSGGRLDLAFVPQVGLPTISAVEISPVRFGASLIPIWNEEFNGPARAAPDPSHWLHQVGGVGWGDHELQAYTDSVDNAATDGRGNLAITARRSVRAGSGDVFTSARLETKQRFRYQYGVLKARIAVPLGRGLWPALWMVGDNSESVGWKAAGEVDIFEGNGALPGRAWFTVHGPDAAGQVYGIGRAYIGPAATAAAYHEYVLTWTPDALGLAIDGNPVFGVTRADLRADQKWAFDHPYRLLLNLAVGGGFVDSPDGSTPFPAVMRIDYIRVLQ